MSIHNQISYYLQQRQTLVNVILKLFVRNILDDQTKKRSSEYKNINTKARVALYNDGKLNGSNYSTSNGITTNSRTLVFTMDNLGQSITNRNTLNSGSYIIYNNLYYKIVSIPEDLLNTRWIKVVGIESNGIENEVII